MLPKFFFGLQSTFVRDERVGAVAEYRAFAYHVPSPVAYAAADIDSIGRVVLAHSAFPYGIKREGLAVDAVTDARSLVLQDRMLMRRIHRGWQRDQGAYFRKN